MIVYTISGETIEPFDCYKKSDVKDSINENFNGCRDYLFENGYLYYYKDSKTKHTQGVLVLNEDNRITLEITAVYQKDEDGNIGY